MIGMDNAFATDVRYWDVVMIVSELYMSGRKRSWMSHRKNAVVDGWSLPTARVILVVAAAADMLLLLLAVLIFWLRKEEEEEESAWTCT